MEIKQSSSKIKEYKRFCVYWFNKKNVKNKLISSEQETC